MSYQLFKDDVLFFQRLLTAEELYTKALDGVWGGYTEEAVTEFERQSRQIRYEIAEFDPRTEKNICTLALKAQRQARYFMKRILEHDINAKIISGTRTYEEQNKLFRQGRYGNPGPIVTNARGGRSNHNFGIAWDIGIFNDAEGYVTNDDAYIQAARACLTFELEWGGDWSNFPDYPHYQLITNKHITVVRSMFENGESFLA